MRRRMLNQMQTEQDEHSRSEAVKARLVPAVSYTQWPREFAANICLSIVNDSVAPQGTMPSSPPVTVPPAPGAPPKRGPGRPRKQVP